MRPPGAKSERPGGKILSSNPNQPNLLLQLATGLQSLLDIAEKGEWEKVDALHQELLQTLETVRAAGVRNLIAAGNIRQIEHVQELLHSATQLCSERKDQIAPLVHAFAKVMDTPAKP